MRDYEPYTGRWTSKEPLGFAGALNFYVYAGNDPVNYADPDGRLLLHVGLGVLYLASSPGSQSRGAATFTARTLYPWYTGTNLLALAYGTLSGGRFEGFDNGTVAFSGTYGERMTGHDRTFGDVICYADAGPPHQQGNRDHEFAHTQQFNMLGPYYLPAHVTAISASYALTQGKRYDDQPLEWGPNQTPSQPWP